MTHFFYSLLQGGYAILSYYKWKFVEALRDLFPELNLDPLKFQSKKHKHLHVNQS